MKDTRQIKAVRKLAALVRDEVDAHFSLRLWDGSLEPLGKAPVPGLALKIGSPGVLPSILRWPTLSRRDKLPRGASSCTAPRSTGSSGITPMGGSTWRADR
jgi:hypothetical protein